MTSNACPFCGGEVRTRCLFGKKSQKWNVNVTCDAGHSVNLAIDKPADTPIPEVAEAALHAFCHPAHICRGMVRVTKELAESAKSAFLVLYLMAVGNLHPCHKKNNPTYATMYSINRDAITAAIDAAKGE